MLELEGEERQLESVTDSTCSKAHISAGFRLDVRSHTCAQEVLQTALIPKTPINFP